MIRKDLAFVVDYIRNQERHHHSGALLRHKSWYQTETAKASVLRSPLQAGSSAKLSLPAQP